MTQKTPIFVDLDKALVSSNLTIEILLYSLKSHPLKGLCALLGLFKGIKFFKESLAKISNIPPDLLPYNKGLLSYLLDMHKLGHPIYLVTSVSSSIAKSIAKYLNIEAMVLCEDKITGSDEDGARTIISAHKYSIANDSESLLPSLQKTRFTFKYFLKTIRVHQWTKNSLIFLPLIAGHQFSLPLIVNHLWAFLSFSLTASSVYILNDILDIQLDRHHPKKKERPIPAGILPLDKASYLFFVLLVSGFFLAYVFLPSSFLLVLSTYFTLTCLYSFYIKSVRLLDVIFLSALYITRVIAGYETSQLDYSNWLLAFTGCLFLSLSFVKRYTEIIKSKTDKIKGRAYSIQDKQMIAQFGITSGYMAILVLTLYIESDAVKQLYRNPSILWGACPLLIYFVSHLWMQAEHGKVNEDPVVYVLKDYRFYVCIACLAVLLKLAT